MGDRTFGTPWLRALTQHALLWAVLAAYLASALVVPTLAPVAIWDDWIYARSVEHFVDTGEIDLNPGAANLLAQMLWGSLFAKVFGFSFGILRVASVALTLIGGAAIYALARELRVPAGLSALATASFLFNPLSYVLTFSFMTDAPFAAVNALSLWCYVRGINRDAVHTRWVLAGSGFAALGFLIRQQGMLIPLSILVCLVLLRRVTINRKGVELSVLVAGLPAVVAVAFQLWLTYVHGTTSSQAFFLAGLAKGPAHLTRVVGRGTFATLAYVGIIALPLIVAALPGTREAFRRLRASGGWWMVPAPAAAALCIFEVLVAGQRFPFASSWVTRAGLGPKDLIKPRPDLYGSGISALVGAIACGALILAVQALANHFRMDRAERVRAMGPALLLAVFVGQLGGVLVPSFAADDPYDRYFLATAPAAIGLLACAAARLRAHVAAGAAVAAIFAVVAVAGTHDFLSFEEAAWKLGDQARASGIPADSLVSTAARDSYLGFDPTRAPSEIPDVQKGEVWWIELNGLNIDQRFAITAGLPEGYEERRRVEYSSWLSRRPTYVMLIERR